MWGSVNYCQGLRNPEKRKQAGGSNQEYDSDFDMLSSLPSLKGKEWARQVVSKHVKKASERVKWNDNASPKTHLFFKSNFTGESISHLHLPFCELICL